MCALISRKYLSDPGMIITYLSEKIQFFWSLFSVFDLEKEA